MYVNPKLLIYLPHPDLLSPLVTIRSIYVDAFESSWGSILVWWGYYSKVPQTGCFKPQKFISLQFWRLEVQDQGGGRVSFFWGLSPWLVDGCLLPVSSHGLSSVCVCDLISSSCKDTSYVGLGPTPMTSFNLNYLFKAPISK